MRDSKIFVISFFVEDIILRILKKNSWKSAQGFFGYDRTGGQNGVPKHFFANILGKMRDNENFVLNVLVGNIFLRVSKKSSSKSFVILI